VIGCCNKYGRSLEYQADYSLADIFNSKVAAELETKAVFGFAAEGR